MEIIPELVLRPALTCVMAVNLPEAFNSSGDPSLRLKNGSAQDDAALPIFQYSQAGGFGTCDSLE